MSESAIDQGAGGELDLVARVAQLEEAVVELGVLSKRRMGSGSPPGASETGGQKLLRGRVDRLEEDVGEMNSGGNGAVGQGLLRGRVKRLEEAVGEIHEAQATMEQSLRVFSLANLKIKRALADVVSDLTTLSAP